MDGAHSVSIEEIRRARAYLNRVGEPAELGLWALVERLGPVEAADAVRREAPSEADPAVLARRGRVCVDDDLDSAQRHGIRLIVPEDPDWPHFALSAMHRAAASAVAIGRCRPSAPGSQRDLAPPLALWVKGPLDSAALATRSVSIVGARSATDYGAHVAGDLAYELARDDIAVVSGGAFGIDAAAHRAALAAEGDTILVSAGGLDRPYPAAHAALYEQVMARGLLISESPPGSPPFRRRFLSRNRLIAAFGTGTVVVEAGRRSGALSTAAHARRLGRPLMAVPGPVTSAMSVGCHELLRRDPSADGQPARLVTSVDDVRAEILGAAVPRPGAGGPGGAQEHVAAAVVSGGAREGGGDRGSQGATVRAVQEELDLLSADEGAVYDALRPRAWTTEDELSVRSGVPVEAVRRALATLIVVGLAQSGPRGCRLKARAALGASGRGGPMRL